MTLRASVLHGVAAAAHLRDDWRALAEDAANAFLTPEWFEAWSRHYAPGDGTDEALVVAVHDGPTSRTGDLVGLVPLAARGREVRFAGHQVADHLAPLARPTHERAVIAATADALARRGVARAVFDNVDGDAPWVAGLVEAWPSRLVRTPVLSSSRPFVDLKGRTWEGFLGERSRNFRQQVRRRRRDLERRHAVRFRLTEDPATLPDDLATFFALHDRRWDTRGGSSSTGETVRAFHLDWARAALERGWLRLWFLECDDEPVAAFYGWNVGGRYCYYLAGFDPAWGERSVGFVLLCHTVEHAFAEGAEIYDLLLGDEEYKSRFADDEVAAESLVLAGPLDPATLKGRATLTARGLADRLPAHRRAQLRTAVRRVVTPPGARDR